MTDTSARLVSKLWSFCQVLRDDGVEDGCDVHDAAFWGRKDERILGPFCAGTLGIRCLPR